MSSNAMISFRPENVIRQIPWRLDSKAALGFLLILATFSLVGWLYLTQASAVTTTSYRIDELRLELDQLKNQNAALVLEIAELEAISRVEVRARELGFGPVTDIQYLPVANYPVPLKPTETAYGLVQVKSNINVSSGTIERSAWWLEKLDAFAAWVEE